ncbi:MAG: hypothetical protein C5S49_03750 [Candidatus Methanogaster sp.]|nr:MAG: hypothetical protein C5S49_03750 [ANME-2 cluster archaeon]
MDLGERTCAVIEIVVTVIPALRLPDPAGYLDRILVKGKTPVTVIKLDRYHGGFGNTFAVPISIYLP